MKVSVKQHKAIKICEDILNIKFEGDTLEEASKFLSENLPKISGKKVGDYREPSDKQWSGIGFIQRETDHVFEGKTMSDASEFISEYLEEAQNKSGRKK